MSPKRVVPLDEDGRLCPAHVAVTGETSSLQPGNVMEARWSEPDTLDPALRRTPWAFSPWSVRQATEMPHCAVSTPIERAHR